MQDLPGSPFDSGSSDEEDEEMDSEQEEIEEPTVSVTAGATGIFAAAHGDLAEEE